MEDWVSKGTDTPKQVRKKMGKLYTGRQDPTDPGDPNNALFQYVDVFIEDPDHVADLRRRYEEGDNIGDGEIKVEVAEAISRLLAPMQERRAAYEGDEQQLLAILKQGSERAIEASEKSGRAEAI